LQTKNYAAALPRSGMSTTPGLTSTSTTFVQPMFYLTGRVVLCSQERLSRVTGIIIPLLPLTEAARDHLAFEGSGLRIPLNSRQIGFIRHHLYSVLERDDRWFPRFKVNEELTEVDVSGEPPTLCSPEIIKIAVALANGDLQRRKEVARRESQLRLVSTLSGEIARGRAHLQTCRLCHLRYDELAYMLPYEPLPTLIRFVIGRAVVQELRRLERTGEQH